MTRKDTPFLETKNMWLGPEQRLISFKNEILPYWTELSQKIAKEPQVTLQNIFLELEQRAR